MVQPPVDRKSFQSFVQVIQALRGPEGCPWDKEQTHESLVRFAIEEVYEYAQAVDAKNYTHMKEELGDVLLQVVLNSVIAEQEGLFTLEDVIEDICEKMVRRHPHVFSTDQAESSEAVLENWESIKKKENPEKKFGFNLPAHLPSLLAALKIGEKTRKAGFDWQKPDKVREKINEELLEVEEALQSGTAEDIESELGDCLFTLAQWCRHLGVDPEQALRKTNRRFENRFIFMQKKLAQEGLEFSEADSQTKEQLWEDAKRSTKK
ncbi:MAG: nucleoside triphosphate pyrophosphohydrolase [Bdellovibrionales bacterium]